MVCMMCTVPLAFKLSIYDTKTSYIIVPSQQSNNHRASCQANSHQQSSVESIMAMSFRLPPLLLISTQSLRLPASSCFTYPKIHPNFISLRELHKNSRKEIKRRTGPIQQHVRSKRASFSATSSSSTSSAAEPVISVETVTKPTARQLLMHALTAAVPMIGEFNFFGVIER